MDAIVLAGGTPQEDDLLFEFVGGRPKALLEIAGKPMVQWVLDALGESKKVDNVVIVGLSPKSGVTCKKPVHYVSNQGRMLANIVAGFDKALQVNPKADYMLVVSSDIPGIKAEMVDWLVETCMTTHEDIYYGVIPREVMEKRYPGSKRTFTKLKDLHLCGADMHIAHVRMATEHLDMWEELIGRRKSPFKQAAAIGFGTLFLLLLGRLTLEETVERVTKRIGITGRPIVWKHAEPGMDVDKPHQLELLRADMQKQVKRAARKQAAKSGKTSKPAGAGKDQETGKTRKPKAA
jgi:molybdopterin-guanine dinucleotide biosynthesis protein A